HYLGYSGFSEFTEGKIDQCEEPDFPSELAADTNGCDEVKSYRKLRGPNQWRGDEGAKEFRSAMEGWAKGVEQLSYKFAHTNGEAFEIPICAVPR
ncbi:hypothetical protein HOY82DRAFT_486475, partial [Tuber indicum]